MADQLHHSAKGWKAAIHFFALQKHQQAIFQSIEFGLAGHQDIERSNWIFQAMFVGKTWAKSKVRIFVRHQRTVLILLLACPAGALQASTPSSAQVRKGRSPNGHLIVQGK